MAATITRERHGRRNRYTINAHLPIPDPIARKQNIGQLLEVLAGTRDEPRDDRSAATA